MRFDCVLCLRGRSCLVPTRTETEDAILQWIKVRARLSLCVSVSLSLSLSLLALHMPRPIRPDVHDAFTRQHGHTLAHTNTYIKTPTYTNKYICIRIQTYTHACTQILKQELKLHQTCKPNVHKSSSRRSPKSKGKPPTIPKTRATPSMDLSVRLVLG